MLNIGLWNIHGFSSHKQDDSLLVELSSKYDVIGFTETMLSDNPGSLPGYSCPFIVGSIKQKKKGRKSGGILVYVKPNIRKAITEVKHSKFSIWLKLDKLKLGLNRTVYLCFCYIPPYKKKNISEDYFSKLENEIEYFRCKGDILICGDLNARTGGLSDSLAADDISESFNDCPLPPTYIPDSQKNRKQMDKKNNMHGSLLVDVCKKHQLRILNGRFLGDSLGYYTFF